MYQLSGRRVLVTGASGLVALPIAVALAKSNEVYALARFSDPEQKRILEAAGARTITFDLAEHDLSPLPRSVDVVINYGVLPVHQQGALRGQCRRRGASGKTLPRLRSLRPGQYGFALFLSGRARVARGRPLRPAQLG